MNRRVGFVTALIAVSILPACREQPAPTPAPPTVSSAGTPTLPAGETTADSTNRHEIPATQSTSAAPADDLTTPPLPSLRPLLDAQTGERCRYRMLNNQEEDLRIVAADDANVSVEVRMFQDGRMLSLPAIRLEKRDSDPMRRYEKRLTIRTRVEPASIEAAGQMWSCQLITDEWADEDVAYVRRIWYNDQAPIYGLVRMEKYDEGRLVAQMELTTKEP